MKYLHPANIRLHGHKDRIDHAVDKFVAYFGSISFLGWQTLIILVWIVINLMVFVKHWDPYPFILLNLVFSTQAAYAAPLILMAQNRQTEHDRISAEESYRSIADIRTQLVELRGMLVGGHGQESDLLQVGKQYPLSETSERLARQESEGLG